MSAVAKDSQVSLQMDGIRNPVSLQPSPTFLLHSYDAAGALIDETTSGLQIQMTSVISLDNVSLVSVSSSMVGASDVGFTFAAQSPYPLSNGFQFKAGFPDELIVEEGLLACYS